MSCFKLVAVTLASVLLASAVPHARSIQWLRENGPAAQALNDQYASLTTSSSCSNDGDVACIDNQFATCYQSRYITFSCPSDWSCAAVPNEFSSGTTTTCDTSDNIAWRFAEAGVSESKRSLPPPKRTSFLEQNGPAAKALNDQYATLTTSSSCNNGEVACVGGQFGVCYENRYLTWSCASDWSCAAVPNEFSLGTTTTCDTNDNIAWRFSQAGISES